MSHSLKSILVISEGRPGHENQSVGLAQALALRTGAEVELVQIPLTWNLLVRARAALNGCSGNPQLVIGAGHKVHLPMWLVSRKFGARSVVVMEPTWPKRLFDLCVLPNCGPWPDPVDPRIISTLGALNRIPELIPEKEARGVILVGGPSKSHGWASASTIDAITAVIRSRPELEWALTDSRRTPDGFLDQLRTRGLDVEMISHRQTTPDWVPSHLLAAREAWATEDSLSMIYEAVTAGARTGVLPVPATRPGADTVQAVQKLIREGYATHFDEWSGNGQRLPEPRPFHETGRCADLVLQKLFSGDASELPAGK